MAASHHLSFVEVSGRLSLVEVAMGKPLLLKVQVWVKCSHVEMKTPDIPQVCKLFLRTYSAAEYGKET